MDTEELKYFDGKFSAVYAKIEATKTEMQGACTQLGHGIEGVRSEVRDQAVKSASRWAAIDKELALHEGAPCRDVERHENTYHSLPKIIGIIAGIMTVASIGAAGIIWLVTHVR